MASATEEIHMVHCRMMNGDLIKFNLPTTLDHIKEHFAIKHSVPTNFVNLIRPTEDGAALHAVADDLVSNFKIDVIIKPFIVKPIYSFGTNCSEKKLRSQLEKYFVIGDYINFFLSSNNNILYGKLDEIKYHREEYYHDEYQLDKYYFTLGMSDCSTINTNISPMTSTFIGERLVSYHEIKYFHTVKVNYYDNVNNGIESHNLGCVADLDMFARKLTEKIPTFDVAKLHNMAVRKLNYGYNKFQYELPRFEAYFTSKKQLTLDLLNENDMRINRCVSNVEDEKHPNLMEFTENTVLDLFRRYKFYLKPHNKLYMRTTFDGVTLPDDFVETFIYGRYIESSGNWVSLEETYVSSTFTLLQVVDPNRTQYTHALRNGGASSNSIQSDWISHYVLLE
jgi:hypothetical protein